MKKIQTGDVSPLQWLRKNGTELLEPPVVFKNHRNLAALSNGAAIFIETNDDFNLQNQQAGVRWFLIAPSANLSVS